MLTLTRRNLESVVLRVGDTTIRVAVLDVDDEGRVKLGFDAPRDCEIYRTEVWNKKYPREALTPFGLVADAK